MKNYILTTVVFISMILFCRSNFTIVDQYQGATFFDNFNFFTDNDPTNGYVDYVSYDDAIRLGLIYSYQDKVYIGSDYFNVVQPQERGRKSVRLESKNTYRGDLVIIDLEHMPTGCGTWPAFWMCGADWPNNGEIDIIENVNIADINHSTLHTNDGCDMKNEDMTKFTGSWSPNLAGGNGTNCYINAPGQGTNQGCSIYTNEGTFGEVFNTYDGGVFATNWDVNNFLSIYFFPRGSIPIDIRNFQPDPSTWGKPYAYYQLGQDCTPDHFQDQSIIINLTFCGDWAGNVFESQCPGRGTCNSFVQNFPQNFEEAYWVIDSITVYQNS